MTSLRIVNWNIEQLSVNKVAIAGIPQAIGQVIVDLQADVVVLLEIRQVGAIAVMTAVSAAASAASVNHDRYTGWVLSYGTGGECYGVLIRDLDEIRPIQVTGGQQGVGNYAMPALVNLDETQFGTWPLAFPNPVAYVALPAPAARPRLPLTDIYASTPPTGRKRQLFGGQTLAGGGYALGRGFRMPSLLMLNVRGAANTYLVPIVACHHGAVRSGTNQLGRAQLSQYKLTHLAQMYATPTNLANQGALWIDGKGVQVQNIIFTGDFNVDFLQNATVGTAMQRGNQAALVTLTPTLQDGGSELPAAAGPAAIVPPGAQPVAPFPAGPISTAVANLTLRAAVTQTGTILRKYDALFVPPNVDALLQASFDNFFYGGADLAAHQNLLGVGAAPTQDAAHVRNIPGQVVNGAGPTVANKYNVSGAWTHHNANVPPTRDAPAAPNLNPAAVAVVGLDPDTALIGARFVSDHVPVLLSFTLP